MLNASVSLNVYENKQVKKLTWIKFPPNLECYRKTSYLRVRTLNGVERKGENRWMGGGEFIPTRSDFDGTLELKSSGATPMPEFCYPPGFRDPEVILHGRRNFGGAPYK
jgi:hypothetical protein